VRTLDITFRQEDTRHWFYTRDIDAVATILVETFREFKVNAKALEEVKLDFADLSSPLCTRKVGHNGCYVLGLMPGQAGSRHAATALHTLSLELTGNEIGNRGAKGLAQLSQAAGLNKLYLGLKNNDIGPEGALYLSTFRGSALKSLHIDLEDNHLGDQGALALATLGSATLHTLNLICKNNGIGNDGAFALAEIKNSAYLRHLHLNVDHNLIDTTGFSEIKSIWTDTNTQLLTMDIHIRNNLVRPGGHG
jgi:hypothetical protein